MDGYILPRSVEFDGDLGSSARDDDDLLLMEVRFHGDDPGTEAADGGDGDDERFDERGRAFTSDLVIAEDLHGVDAGGLAGG